MKAKWKNSLSNRLARSLPATTRLRPRLSPSIATSLLAVLVLSVPMTVVRAQEGTTLVAATAVPVPIPVPTVPVLLAATTVPVETNRVENAATPSADPAIPAVAAKPPVVPSPPAAPAPAPTIAQATPTPNAPVPTDPKGPVISAPVAASPAVSAPPVPEDRPVRVGKLSPEALKARQDAEDRARAAQARGPAAAEASSADRDADTNPQTPLDYLKDNEWQRHAEIRSGNVTVLRRSTDEPPAPNETVILRWRTPTEFSRNAFMSSKSHTPNMPGK